LIKIIVRWVEDNPSDATILLAGALLLAAVSAVACLVPAFRVSRIDPMAAVRID
jgi:ABC-type antimicrobial peptide transport system permease subunit